MYKRSDGVTKKYVAESISQITPGLPIPAGVRPFIEMMFNKNFYSGAPVIGLYELQRLDELQVRPSTRMIAERFSYFGSNLAAFLFRTKEGAKKPVPLTPIEMDYVIGAYFTGIMQYPFDILESADLSKTPVIGETLGAAQDFLRGKKEPLKGEKPTLEDFENHLGTIFTEIRLKQVIEFRSLDTCNFGCICNGPSFFTGLIYGSLDETYEIIKNWKKEDVMDAYLNAPKQGLNTLLKNKKLIDWAKIFLDLSKKGLDKRNELNKSGKNETIYLKHIEEIISNKKTRAEMLIEQYNKTKKLDFLINHDENFSYSGF